MDHTRKRFKKKNITNALLTVVGILVVVMIFLPILWMVRTSVITLVDLYERPLVQMCIRDRCVTRQSQMVSR